VQGTLIPAPAPVGSTLDWQADVLGLPVRFQVPSRLAERLCQALAPRIVAVRSRGSGANVQLTYEVRESATRLDVVRLDGANCELIDTADSVDRAADLIANDLHRWVAEHHLDLLVVHAGAVEWRGVGILVPGRSHSGKSSLTAALLEAGASYLSDEFAPIDGDGKVHPYPRHLSLRRSDGSASLYPAEHFAARTTTTPVPVRYVVDARYVPGSTFEPARTRGSGPLMSLADNALVARSRPAHTMAILARLAPHVIVLRSDRGDAAAAARTILDLVDTDRQRSHER
jgi:hypothetical protein